MDKDRRVTIVIPTFNRAHMVHQAIDSAIGQTYPCDVIVCDHGSTDNTAEVVAGYGDQVRYIRRQCDSGPFFCWLDGVLHADSEYVHITYDDDWIAPEFIEETIALMDDETGLVFTAVEIHRDNGENVLLNNHLYNTGTYRSFILERRLLRGVLTFSPGCGLFRKQDMIQAISYGWGAQAKSLHKGAGPDLLIFLFPLLNYRKFGFVDKPLAHFLGHTGSITISAEKSGNMRSLEYAYRFARETFVLYGYGRFAFVRGAHFIFRRIVVFVSVYLHRFLVRFSLRKD